MRIMRSSRIKRLRGNSPEPVIEDRPDKFLFNSGPQLRKLRVIVDVDSQMMQTGIDELNYLLGLLRDESIISWNYSDSGPPADAAAIENEWIEAIAGWITVRGDDSGFTFAHDGAVTSSVLHLGSLGHLVREEAMHNKNYRDRGGEDSAEQRFADLRLLKVAQAANIDLIVSDRPYLNADPFNFVSHGITEVVPYPEALAVIGLYLRTQRRYVVDAGQAGGRLNFNKGLVTWVASRALLPEGWRWMSACVQHSTHTGDDMLTYYAGTAHHRLERALDARDALFVALNQPQNNDTADDAMTAFDSILINLSACLDVTARVCNYALGSPSQAHLVGWGRKPWLKLVRKLDGSLAALMGDLLFTNLIVIVGELRNTIHGAALDSMAVTNGMSMQQDDTVVGLPADRLIELLNAMDSLGGRNSWGVRELIPGRAHADLDVLCERLMHEVPLVVNRIMKLTPVESMEGVALTPEISGPDESEASSFKARFRNNILLQYGLNQP